MTSKTFNLGDNSDSGSGPCGKICMFFCGILIVVVIVAVAIYAYKTNVGAGISDCPVPILDENGLSNWTTGAEMIAYACFPGYFLEGHSNIMVAACENGSWQPPPPACNFLPLRLNCWVNYKGLKGNISMWQKQESDPAFIYGLVNYDNVSRKDGHLLDIVSISKASCQISDEIANVKEMYIEPPADAHTIKIEFNSTKLKAFNKAEIHINLIFVDKNTTATLVSVHQDNLTIVMPNSIPIKTRWTREYLQDMGLREQEIQKMQAF